MKKSVLITGANRGIGLGLTKLYAKNGWTVYATARDLSTAKELQSLRSDKVQLHSLDISSDESVGQLQREISQISHLDLLINNAGILRGENQGFSELKMLDLAESFDVNVLGAIRVTKACLEKLSKSTSPKVVHITSMMGSITDNRSGGYYAYRISKAALNMMNKSFSVDHPSYTGFYRASLLGEGIGFSAHTIFRGNDV